jgi:hypothetical protein
MLVCGKSNGRYHGTSGLIETQQPRQTREGIAATSTLQTSRSDNHCMRPVGQLCVTSSAISKGGNPKIDSQWEGSSSNGEQDELLARCYRGTSLYDILDLKSRTTDNRPPDQPRSELRARGRRTTEHAICDFDWRLHVTLVPSASLTAITIHG